jgi:Tol biopolymer transport system component
VAPPAGGLAVVAIDGTAPIRTFAYTYTPGEGFGGTWAPDGRAFEDLVYRDGATNLWRFPLDGSPPRAVTAFASDQILNYRWSRDGKTLVMSRGTRSSDLVLITNDDR